MADEKYEEDKDSEYIPTAMEVLVFNTPVFENLVPKTTASDIFQRMLDKKYAEHTCDCGCMNGNSG